MPSSGFRPGQASDGFRAGEMPRSRRSEAMFDFSSTTVVT